MIRQGMPQQTVPFVGADGIITPVWFPFIVSLYERTGGAAGVDVVTVQQAASAAQQGVSTASDDAFLIGIEDGRFGALQALVSASQPPGADPALVVLLLEGGR